MLPPQMTFSLILYFFLPYHTATAKQAVLHYCEVCVCVLGRLDKPLNHQWVSSHFNQCTSERQCWLAPERIASSGRWFYTLLTLSCPLSSPQFSQILPPCSILPILSTYQDQWGLLCYDSPGCGDSPDVRSSMHFLTGVCDSVKYVLPPEH